MKQASIQMMEINSFFTGVQQHIIILNDNVSLYNLINEIFQSIPQTNKKLLQ